VTRKGGCAALSRPTALSSNFAMGVFCFIIILKIIFNRRLQGSFMKEEVIIEWNFSPSNYFEDAIKICDQNYTMNIENGKVKVKIHSEIYDADPSIRRRLHDDLNDRFLGILLLTHRDYKLSRSEMTRIYPDGRKDTFVEVKTDVLKLSCFPADINLIDKDGIVISDSRRDKIEKEKRFTELVAKYKPNDELLGSVILSYALAVREPKNELVYLYEIREAISKKFGNGEKAKSALFFSSSQWSRLGKLANDEPLKQGRHRGKDFGALRDATESELKEARAIAFAMIEAYIKYIDASTVT